MTWRSSVNQKLAQLTGYELRKARPAGKATPTPKAAPKPAAPKPAGLRFPADYDDGAKEIITAVKPWTMTSVERLNALVQSVRYITRHELPGDIVECGVWRGGSMQAVARTLLSLDVTDRELYLFDTFEGMTEPTEEDKRVDGASAADLLATQGKDRPIWALATLDDVQDGFSRIDYPAERLHYVQGKVEDTIPEQAPEQIAILRLDTDWYTSTKHELEHLYDRLVPGGVLLLDDYGYWQGSRQAVDEFLEETGARLLLTRMDEGRIAVKP
ncbi:TylF/MycF/NovP-related O-methyltransferase [Streptomyces sp. NPDC101132]|uniref:TylF/MycF/NovP-related O-methyltransferase n=1 Tax=Streptomyces sp. NPDC101132 TaxID=3366110 RepID=UPI00381B66A5